MRFPRSARVLGAMLLALVALAPATATPVSAGSVIPPSASVTVTLGDCDLSGNGNLVVTGAMVVQHFRGATLLEQFEVIVSGGTWSILCTTPVYRGGDRIDFIRGGDSSAFRSFTIPKLKLSPDRAANVVTGKVPDDPDGAFVSLSPCAPSGSPCQSGPELDITPNPDGTFSVPAPGLSGGTSAVMLWFRGADAVGIAASTPRLVVRPGSAIATIQTRARGLTPTVTLKRGTLVATATLTLAESGDYTGTFRRNGVKVKVKTGDVISASVATDARFTVPATSLSSTATSVSGQCFKGATVEFTITDAGSSITSHNTVNADPTTGAWTHAGETIAPTDRIQAWCRNKNGDVLAFDTGS